MLSSSWSLLLVTLAVAALQFVCNWFWRRLGPTLATLLRRVADWMGHGPADADAAGAGTSDAAADAGTTDSRPDTANDTDTAEISDAAADADTANADTVDTSDTAHKVSASRRNGVPPLLRTHCPSTSKRQAGLLLGVHEIPGLSRHSGHRRRPG